MNQLQFNMPGVLWAPIYASYEKHYFNPFVEQIFCIRQLLWFCAAVTKQPVIFKVFENHQYLLV